MRSNYIHVYKNEKYFSERHFFLYSLCPNLEGIKDVLSYKSRRRSELLCRVRKQGCQGLGPIEMHSRARVSGASATRFDRPARQATEPRAKREAMSALCYGLVVDSTFEQSENVLSAVKAWVTVECRVFTDNFNAIYFSNCTSYELLCTNRKFHLHPLL